MVSSTDGASTNTSWKRLVNAPSSSIFSRYSSNVVAPIHCTCPRANAGLRILDASKAPLTPPAPTIVCNSSMNIITLSLALSSSTMFFILSSNSPLYLVPATIVVMFNEISLLLIKTLATFLSTIRCAIASTIAVLPTPGSPKIIGLFFFLRAKI